MRFFVAACALFALASPALGEILVVHEDYVLNASNVPSDGPIFVQGDATLTITGNPTINHRIWMFDRSSLIVEGGTLIGEVWLADTHHVMFTGGELDSLSRIRATAGSINNDLQFLGGDIRGEVQLREAYEQHQVFIDYTKYDADQQPPRVIRGNAETFVQGVADNPYYHDSSIGDALVDLTRVDNPPAWSLASTGDFLSGDSNRDGQVDLADLNAVRNNFGTLWPLDMAGDTLPYNGVVDLEDLNRVRNNFGASSNPVPEPASLCLIGLSLLAASPLRRRCCRLTRRSP
jgi:hypothetical protein